MILTVVSRNIDQRGFPIPPPPETMNVFFEQFENTFQKAGCGTEQKNVIDRERTTVITARVPGKKSFEGEMETRMLSKGVVLSERTWH